MPTLFNVTNASGYVTFQNATAGLYTFKIIKEGYPTQNETIPNYNGEQLTLSIALTGSSSNGNSGNNLIIIVIVIVVAVAVAVIAGLLLMKRKTNPNIKKLQELQRQMKNQYLT
jgi:hypothetical protein